MMMHQIFQNKKITQSVELSAAIREQLLVSRRIVKDLREKQLSGGKEKPLNINILEVRSKISPASLSH